MDRATVIVALPPVDDRVNRVSSEKMAHLTLLFLGEADLSAEAILYVQHACSELSPFGLTVDYRGTLGDDDADVLFFEKNAWDIERVSELRHHLLLNDEIKRAYDAAFQYPEWTPHLTLGYPETPSSDDEEGRIHYVNFDRIAVWTGDFEGPEFRLEHDNHALEVSMSDQTEDLSHYGVKGMKWGVTTKDNAPKVTQTREKKAFRSAKDVTVTQRKAGTYVKTKGGQRQKASEDAVKAQASRQKAKKSTTDALSTKELKDTIERMRLEQEFNKLDAKVKRRGESFVSKLLSDPDVRKVAEDLNSRVALANN